MPFLNFVPETKKPKIVILLLRGGMPFLKFVTQTEKSKISISLGGGGGGGGAHLYQ